MGIAKDKRPSYNQGSAEKVQSITPSGASGAHTTKINPHGLTTIVSTGTGAGWVLAINSRPVAQIGTIKRIAVASKSTAPVTVLLPSTATVIHGSTNNGIAFSTGAGLKFAQLQKVTTTSWALVGASTGVTPGASTSPF